MCIAGVADQLQTNFASDLRQILRSVFLMNVSPPPIEDIEIDISGKSKDSTSDLFEFRASENDVIHENDGGSNQSIYSAEEANPETDSVFEQSIVQSLPPGSDHQERSASLETEIRITHSRVNVERSQSLGDETNARPVSLVVNTTHQIQCVERNGNHGESNDNSPQSLSRITANVNNNNANVNNNQSPRSVDNSSTLATTTTTIILTTNSRLNRNDAQTPQQQQQITETPPRWIPDEEAAQCKFKLNRTFLFQIFLFFHLAKISKFEFSIRFRYVLFTNIYNISTTSSLPMLWRCILWDLFKFASTTSEIRAQQGGESVSKLLLDEHYRHFSTYVTPMKSTF